MKSIVLLTLVLCVCSTALATPITFTATLSGANEFPTNNSPAVGNAIVVIDPDAHTLRVLAIFSGLLAPTTASHIHCCTALPQTGTAGVATQTPTFSGMPLGVTAGSMDQTLNTLDAASYNPAFITANGGTAASAEAVLFANIIAGKTYFNIHTAAPNGFPSGEIRGFLLPAAAVPEPAALGLIVPALAGVLAAAGIRRRR